MRVSPPRTSPSSLIAAAVAHEGMSVWPGFLNASQVGVIAGQCRRQQGADDSAFQRALIGRGSERVIDDAVRRDHTWGIEPATASKAVRRYLARLKTLRHALNRSLFLGLHDWEGHFAFYPPGAFYQRHLDRFRSDDRRFVSTVLYLNVGWLPGDGGALRVHLPPGAPTEHVDLAPLAGTLVTFLSDAFPHEVLPGLKDRFSVAGWFRTS